MSISLNDALRVCQIVAPHVPEDEIEVRVLAHILIKAVSPEEYADLLTLLTGYPRKTIEENPDGMLWLSYFIAGLEQIGVWTLVKFGKTIGLKYV